MLLKKAYKWYLREKVEKVLTVSEFSKNEISKILKVNLDDITVLGNSLGFDKNSYKEIETDSLTSDNKNYIVIGGPIHVKKGGESIIKLCNALEKKRSDVNIYITGGLDQKYQRTFREAKLTNTKIFSVLASNDIIKLVKNALCYIQLSNFESFGIMVIEAMYLGTPVIINNAPGLLEISKGNSIICNNNDTDDIILKIESLENDENYRNEMIKNGIAHASKFNWSSLAKLLVTEINKTIKI